LWLSSAARRSQVARQPRRTRLFVERLEDRYCPSAPVISNFTATPTTGTTVQLTGNVSDANPASVQISFGGVMSGSVSANAQGYFSYTAQASGLGTVTATGVDGQNLTSNTAQAQVSAQNPSIQMSASYGTGRTVTLTGTVTDETPGGRTVTFTGEVIGSVTTNANGTFSYTATATALGNVTAQTTDPWGLSSAPAQVTLAVAAPVISNFQVVHQYGTTWVVEGHVTAPDSTGMTVRLGGLPALQGKTATVDGNGNFEIEVTIPNGQWGTATADVTDAWGQSATQAQFAVA